MNKELILILISCLMFLLVNDLFAAHRKNKEIPATEFVHKKNKEITVTGLVYKEFFYEQPKYGTRPRPETDTIAGACIIKLDSAVTTKDQKQLERLHLIFPHKMTNCTTVSGHRIEISGNLSDINTGHQHGDAVIDVNSYRIIR